LAIEVVGFSEEEGVRFGIPFIGSRALAGTLDPAVLEHRDDDGCSIREAIVAYGLDPATLRDAIMDQPDGRIPRAPHRAGACARLHAASARRGERDRGQSRFLVTFEGKANHAGTTPMGSRHDAVAGAAEWIARVENEAMRVKGSSRRSGAWNRSPGGQRDCRRVPRRHSTSGIPQTRFGRRCRLLTGAAREIGIRRGLHVVRRAAAGPALRAHGRAVARTAGTRRRPVRLSAPRHGERRGHDAMVLAPELPVAMLFLSHARAASAIIPTNRFEDEDVEAALRVGSAFLEDLAAAAS
jgi:allantoate deiminase